jgi:hypothetical protein
VFFVTVDATGRLLLVRPTGPTTADVESLSTPPDASRAYPYATRIPGRAGALIAFLANDTAGRPQIHVVDTERPDAGDTLATAFNAGVVPGMHVGGVTLASSADVDLYRVELLRTDSLRATASLDVPGGSLSLAILDASGQTVATATPSGGQMVANAASLPAGTYYLRVAGTVPQKAWYRVGVDAGSGSTTRVIYVNDGSSSQDVYALATGDDANDGLSADRPKA